MEKIEFKLKLLFLFLLAVEKPQVQANTSGTIPENGKKIFPPGYEPQFIVEPKSLRGKLVAVEDENPQHQVQRVQGLLFPGRNTQGFNPQQSAAHQPLGHRPSDHLLRQQPQGQLQPHPLPGNQQRKMPTSQNRYGPEYLPSGHHSHVAHHHLTSQNPHVLQQWPQDPSERSQHRQPASPHQPQLYQQFHLPKQSSVVHQPQQPSTKLHLWQPFTAQETLTDQSELPLPMTHSWQPHVVAHQPYVPQQLQIAQEPTLFLHPSAGQLPFGTHQLQKSLQLPHHVLPPLVHQQQPLQVLQQLVPQDLNLAQQLSAGEPPQVLHQLQAVQQALPNIPQQQGPPHAPLQQPPPSALDRLKEPHALPHQQGPPQKSRQGQQGPSQKSQQGPSQKSQRGQPQQGNQRVKSKQQQQMRPSHRRKPSGMFWLPHKNFLSKPRLQQKHISQSKEQQPVVNNQVQPSRSPSEMMNE